MLPLPVPNAQSSSAPIHGRASQASSYVFMAYCRPISSCMSTRSSLVRDAHEVERAPESMVDQARSRSVVLGGEGGRPLPSGCGPQ